MPKYHLHKATDNEEDMRSMLQLALAKDIAGKTAAIICPDAGHYTIKQHMYLRRSFVSIYVAADKAALDTHKHFIEAGGHSEHAWFINRLQTPAKLDRIATGPKNSMPHHTKPKPKSKVPEELRQRLQCPSRRGLMENHAAIPLPVGEPDKTALVSVSVDPGSETSFTASSSQQGLCKARLWADGLLSQCGVKTGDKDFCKRHFEVQSHGRIDEDAPPEVAAKARKHLLKRTQTPISHSQSSEQSTSKKKRQGDVGEQTGMKVDEFLRGVVQAWMGNGGFSADDIDKAVQLSLQPDPEQVAKRNARSELVNGRLEFFGRKREGTPTDGNCQFIAVARGLGRPDAAHLELRKEVVEYLKKNRREFKEFTVEGSWDAYIEYISAAGGWGDHVTLTVLSRLYYCEFQIVTDRSTLPFVTTITPPEIRRPGIVLVHYGEVHYESTVTI